MPTITVKIDKFGQPTIEADGFVGTACEKATASLEATLRAGADNVKRKRKPEAYEAAQNHRAVTNVGGER